MELILNQYVKGLGEKNDVVTVRDGYARNYLIPRGYATLATKAALKQVEENRKQAAHRLEHVKNEALKLKEKIEGMKFEIATLAGADGKLFGSITSLMVENKLKELGIEVDRRRISFDADIKTTGSHTAVLDLHKEVKAKLTIEVSAQA